MISRRVKILLLFIGIAGLIFILHSVTAWTPAPVVNDHNVFMPGTQPNDAGTFESPGKCDNCHGGYDTAVEPDYNWRGSMMAQAARDPLWLACLTVSEQDSIWAVGNPNAGDLCIRCHSPTGWLEGRSEPVNTNSLTGDDFWGVQCDFCHRMVDPLTELDQPDVPPDIDPGAITLAQETKTHDITVLLTHTMFNGTPFLNSSTNLPMYYGDGSLPNYIENGAGQFFVDPTNTKRGPFYDANPTHQFYYSRYHQSKMFCFTCHDVSNPVLASIFISPEAPETMAPSSYFHVERTSSEFMLSAYGSGGAETNISGVSWADTCQDCHMKDGEGYGCNKAGVPYRTDLPVHDFAGGNTWITGILATTDQSHPSYDQYNYDILSGAKYTGAQIDVTGLQGYGQNLQGAMEKAKEQLEAAANLSILMETQDNISLRVQNNAGHKLISGFPEGRRMFLSVRFYDFSGSLIGELNPYEPLATTQDVDGNEVYVSGGNLTKTNNELVWECEMASNLTGENKSFHFALATDRYKDNRIPPKGFDTSGMYDRLAQPRWEGEDAPDYFTAEEYAGGYDDILITKPPSTASWNVSLYYQTTSKEYIEFLRDEINGNATTLTSPTPSGEPAAYIVQTDPFFDNLKGWGDAIWDLWLHNNGSQPFLMKWMEGGSVPVSMELEPGWNLISLPLIQLDEDVGTVLQSIDGDYDAVQWYNSSDSQDQWKHNASINFVNFNELTQLNHRMGIWIHIINPAGTTLYPSGSQPVLNQQVSLVKGWNMVGYPSMTVYNRTMGLNNLVFGVDVDVIQWYDATSQSWHFMGPSDSFAPGRGYWVHSKVDINWDVSI